MPTARQFEHLRPAPQPERLTLPRVALADVGVETATLPAARVPAMLARSASRSPECLPGATASAFRAVSDSLVGQKGPEAVSLWAFESLPKMGEPRERSDLGRVLEHSRTGKPLPDEVGASPTAMKFSKDTRCDTSRPDGSEQGCGKRVLRVLRALFRARTDGGFGRVATCPQLSLLVARRTLGATKGTRTLDNLLGRQGLCQLSYRRKRTKRPQGLPFVAGGKQTHRQRSFSRRERPAFGPGRSLDARSRLAG